MFRIFEPSALIGLRLNWISRVLVLIFITPIFWASDNFLRSFLKNSLKLLDTEFKAIFGVLAFPGSTIMPVILFVFILLNNFFGLFPYIFTSSRHLRFTLRLALPLWLGHIIWAFVFSFEGTMAHFVPLRTPVALIPLIVIIEFIRRMIRPLTLAVRLAANIIAGHLLLSLLSEKIVRRGWLIPLLVLSALIRLTFLELGVRIIQSYVFSLLSTLYLNEVNSDKYV